MLSGLLVTQYRGRSQDPSHQWGFLTTLDIRTRKQALTVYCNYDGRSLVENKGYRELKQGFKLTHYIQRLGGLVYRNSNLREPGSAGDSRL